MDFEHGLALFFIGCTLTVIGFLIAFMIASRVIHKQNKKNKPLTSVEPVSYTHLTLPTKA